jgi:hypothetical protein
MASTDSLVKHANPRTRFAMRDDHPRDGRIIKEFGIKAD